MMGLLEAGLESMSGLMACPSVGVLACLAPRRFDGDYESRTVDSGQRSRTMGSRGRGFNAWE